MFDHKEIKNHTFEEVWSKYTEKVGNKKQWLKQLEEIHKYPELIQKEICKIFYDERLDKLLGLRRANQAAYRYLVPLPSGAPKKFYAQMCSDGKIFIPWVYGMGPMNRKLLVEAAYQDAISNNNFEELRGILYRLEAILNDATESDRQIIKDRLLYMAEVLS